MDAFSAMHPVVNFIWFASVISLSFFLMHPSFLAISLACALMYAAVLGGRRLVARNLLLMAPIFLIAAIVNPIFNRNGMTPLFMLGESAVTLEALLYGFASGAMFVCVLAWFSCFGRVITADKITYLFGRAAPAMSLILCMVLRFVPRYRTQIKEIAAAQRGIGRGSAGRGLISRIKSGLALLSAMTTWALEGAVVTADSMRARGYGLKGRSSFAIFRQTRRDFAFLAVTLALLALVVAGMAAGGAQAAYFPRFAAQFSSPAAIFTQAAYFALCALPVLAHILEQIKWKRLQSTI